MLPYSDDQTSDCSKRTSDEMDLIRNQTSGKSQISPDSYAQTSDCSGETDDISELNKKLESSLYVSKEPESNSTEAEPCEQCNIPQASVFQESRPKIHKQPSFIETVQIPYESSQNDDKIYQMDQSQPSNESQNSPNSNTQISSNQAKDSSENNTTLSKKIESSLYVSKKPESNSTEVESCKRCNIPQASVFRENRQKICRRPSLSGTLYRPYESSPSKSKMSKSVNTNDYKSSSAIKKTVERKKDVGMQQPPLHSGRSPRRSRSNYRQNAQHGSNIFPVQHSPGPYPNENPSHLQRIINPVQNQACTYAGQYPKQSLMNPNFAYIPKTDGNICSRLTALPALKQNNIDKTQFSFPVCRTMDSHQLELQSPKIKTAAKPVLLPRKKRESYNPMPPMRTNAVPMRYIQSSSYYRNTIPPVRTNAAPMRYVGPSSQYRNQKPPIMNNTTSMRYIQRTETTTTNVSGGIDFTSDVIQNRLDLTSEIPDQVFKSAMMQLQKSAHKETDNLNTIDSNLDQSKKLTETEEEFTKAKEEFTKTKEEFTKTKEEFTKTKEELTKTEEELTKTEEELTKTEEELTKTKEELTKTKEELTKTKEELAKTSCNSNINIWNVDVSKKLLAASYFPFCSTPRGKIASRPLQRVPIQFPTPSSKGYYEKVVVMHQQQPSQHLGTCAQLTSNHYSYPHAVVTDQLGPRPATQDNLLTQSGSHTTYPIQPEIQAAIMNPYRTQYQPNKQNLTQSPQYQDSNHSIYQYGTQYQPAMQNVTEASNYQNLNPPMDQYQPTTTQQYQDPNQPIYQYGTQFQPNMRNPTAAPQYRNPNQLQFQYGTQYQSPMQDPIIESQYQNPNPSMVQYQPAMQNTTAASQYQDPNQPMYQNGKQTSLESSWPINMSCSYPVYDASIPIQQENSNRVPMQTPATNPSFTSMHPNTNWPYGSCNPSYPFTGDTNLVSNISGVPRHEGNLSSISMCHYPSWSYATSETTSQICRYDPYQGSNPNQGNVPFNIPQIMDPKVYPVWSVSTGDP